MKQATLLRTSTGDEGTFGELVLGTFRCFTLELPWRGNARGQSCVPAGTYLFKWRTDSPKHGSCYEEWDNPATPAREDVKDRDNIQIHAANLAGDATKGYVKQLDGCIAPGKAIGVFKAGDGPAGDKDQRGVVGSKIALNELVRILAGETFELAIVWSASAEPAA